MKPSPILILVLLLSPLPLLAAEQASAVAPATEVQALAWMSGEWRAERNGTEMLEQWTDPAGGMMLGVHRDVRSDGRAAFEFLRISETPEGIVYFASPSGRAATEFKLVESEPERAVFANPDHDFPKRIVYWIAGDGALHARAEGDDGQGPEWRWEKKD